VAAPDRQAAGVTVLAEGRTTAGEHWSLASEPSPMGRDLGVRVTSADGHPYWGTGCILGGSPQQEPVNLTTGSDDDGPSTLILAVRADVRAVVVLLSDGTREDLRLHAVPDRSDIRAAALVYPRQLDVHRIDLYDGRGVELPDMLLP
jgi:hypothetical protein